MKYSGRYVALAMVLSLGACSTIEDSWDYVFGSDETAPPMEAATADSGQTVMQDDGVVLRREAPPPASGLVAEGERPGYVQDQRRRAPSSLHALAEEGVAPPQVETAAAPFTFDDDMVARPDGATAPAPAPRSQVAEVVDLEPIEPYGNETRDPLALALMGQHGGGYAGESAMPLMPMHMASAAPLLLPPAAGGDGLGTTVIGGDGRVYVDPSYGAPLGGMAGGSAYAGMGMGGVVYSDGSVTVYDDMAAGYGGSAPGTLVATIHFNHGSAGLSDYDREVLRQVVDLQRRYGGTLRVVGHASSRTGDMPLDRHMLANFTTSVERAERVTQALYGLGAARGSVVQAAVSDSQPIYHETMPSGEAGNRRVEIHLDY